MLPDIKTDIPGPNSRRLAARLRECESRNVTFVSADFPVFWERARGVNVWDADGNRFLDFTSAFGVTGLGHGHPRILEAMRQQSEVLLHSMGDVHPAAVKVDLCTRLSQLTFERWKLGRAKTILANSGFEAVEAALKTALLKTSRPRVLTFEGAYHGVGYGAIAAGAPPAFREPFLPQIKAFGTMLPLPAGDPAGPLTGDLASTSLPDNRVAAGIEAVRTELVRGDVGAILLEPVQGRGGKVLAHPAFLTALRALCNETGTVLIFDEILTGLNRTGKLFAAEHFAVFPDIICLGKSLTSGFPLSACVARAEVMDAWPESSGEALHTSTFLGNPVGCAMALASLELHSDPATSEKTARAGRTLRTLLQQLDSPHTGGVRGLGLLQGLELIDPASGKPDQPLARAMVTRALKDGLILLADSPGGNVLSLVPPFDISTEELTWTCDRIQEYLTSLPGSIS